jgi:hypothetical protein
LPLYARDVVPDDEVNAVSCSDPAKLRIASTRRHASRSYFTLHHKSRPIRNRRPSLPEIIDRYQQREDSQFGNRSNQD